MAQFGTIITNIGLAKITNAQVTQETVGIKHMVLGDGNGAYYTLSQSQTNLRREVWRGLIADEQKNPSIPNRIAFSAYVPSTAGGFTIREVGLLDTQGNLIAVSLYPEQYKPQLAEGVSDDLLIHFVLETSNASVVTLAVDPTIVIASRKYVDDKTASLQEQVTNHAMDDTRHNSYGTSSTASATVAKVVTCSGFKLATGAHIDVKFTNENKAVSPTLNVNSTGAKPIYQNGTVGANWSAGEIVEFVYDGTNWCALTTGKDAIDHANNKNNPHSVNSEQVNYISGKYPTDLSSEYPKGYSVMYVNPAESNHAAWVDLYKSLAGLTNADYAGYMIIVETTRSNSVRGAVQRLYGVSNFTSNSGTIWAEFIRGASAYGTTGPWGVWRKQLSEDGGELKGILIAQPNTSYTISQVRNVRFGTTEPTGPIGGNGDIYYQYE